MALTPCPRCGSYARAGRPCPFCGAESGVARSLRLPAAALLMLNGCFLKSEEQALYGAPITVDDSAEDGDGDGFSPARGDCNDDDASVFPGADDPVGDGLDTDCDNEDG